MFESNFCAKVVLAYATIILSTKRKVVAGLFYFEALDEESTWNELYNYLKLRACALIASIFF